MLRIDHCGNLIHFTKGKNKPLDYDDAYDTLKQIIRSKALKASSGMILGYKKCVCFTEAPVNCLTISNKLDTKYFSRYTPFGIQFTKKEVFKNGGRPVIYSLREEYELEKGNDRINWRFVSYDPNKDGKKDFTWEREWRIKCSELEFDYNASKLVFPNQKYIDLFVEDHEREFHGLEEDDDCEDCFCTRDVTVYRFVDFIENCETLTGTCPDPAKFPWIIINMDEK